MKKVLWLIVCLMTMVFTSCGSNSSDEFEKKFNLDISKVTDVVNTSKYENIIDALHHIENYYYFHSKYDLSEVNFLKTKIHICNDSIVFGEFYVRGKNSFDGGTCDDKIFIFYKNNDGKYFKLLTTEQVATLMLRMDFEDNKQNKYNIIKKFVIKHGYLNNETDYECSTRRHKPINAKSKNEIKWTKEYLDKELDIN